MARPDLHHGNRKLTAIMFTDIVGFSRQMGTDEARMLRLLAVHNQLIHQTVNTHHGHVIKTIGDAFLVDFPSVVHAVQCAQAIHAQLRAYNAEKDKAEQIHVRIGIHLGDIVQKDGDVFGDGVNIASRLQTLAEPDTICISQKVYEEVAKKIDLGTVVPLGKPKLKNIAERFAVYALLPESPKGVRQQLHVHRLELSRRLRPSVFAFVSGALVVGLLVGRYLSFLTPNTQHASRNTQESLPLPDKPSIVVLPFDNMSNDPEQDYFSDGIPEDLTLEAYDYYLRGRELGIRAWVETKKEANVQARQLLEKALELDPTYAEAYATLALTYSNDWFLGWNRNFAQTVDRAFATASKAVAIDDTLSSAHQRLGFAYLWKRQYDQAVTEARRAVTLDPNDANAYTNLGTILGWTGQSQEAIELLETGIRLNPRFPTGYLNQLSFAYRMAGRYEEAVAASKKLLARNSNFMLAHLQLANCYAQMGRLDEAHAAAAEVLRIMPNFSLEALRQNFPFKDPVILERELDAWRKAGLK